jgi:hypothetical protein
LAPERLEALRQEAGLYQQRATALMMAGFPGLAARDCRRNLDLVVVPLLVALLLLLVLVHDHVVLVAAADRRDSSAVV